RPSRFSSPETIASVGRLEAEANAAPLDEAKQIALYQGLLRLDMKEGLDRLLARWERMCQFDRHSPLIRSDTLFQLYCTALAKSGLQKSILPAARHRESLLALPPPSPVQPATSNSQPTPSVSSSEQIAQAALSGQLAPLGTPSASPVGVGATPAATVAQILSQGGTGVVGNPIHVSVSEPKGAALYRIIRFIVLTGVGAFFILTFFAVLLENSGLLKAGPQTTQFEPTQGKTVKFSDVHGVDEAKEELKEVVQFLKDPTKFSTLGGRLPKGVLLTGPPGTGKTMLARAVAGEAGVPFLYASGAEFDEIFVGVGAKRIRELFATARKKQPAIIFIDELDAIGSKRSPKDQHYMKQTLNQLLVELDGFAQTEGVIVIAATNFPQTLDNALVRPGRFDKKIAVPLPDVKGRSQILKHHMANIISSTDVDPMIIARGTAGFSGADLQNMVNQAAVQASRDGCQSVELKHFEWAKDRIIMGAERKTQYIDDKVKKLTAYHEGGHALVALYTEGAMPLHKVTCVPRGHALGMTTQLPEGDRFSVSRKEFLAEIDVCMGGRVAEELVYGYDAVTSGASSDLEHATDTAKRMVTSYGLSDKIGPVYISESDMSLSPQIREDIEREVRSIVEAGQSRVLKLLKEREVELHRLADALIEHETLDSNEVRRVVRGDKVRESEESTKL
ncbi:ATP-dependent metallopeptidase Hfl, partial [Sistotremastrum suecicum HHB10207 ss-3]